MKLTRHVIFPLLAATAALLAAGCGQDQSVEPTVPPHIVSVSPADSATSVDVTTAVAVTFSEDIDPATVTDANFYFLDSVGGSFEIDGKSVRLVPPDSLEFSTVYTVVVTRGIRATNGEPLDEGRSWSFTTMARPATTHAPVITGFTPTGAYAGALLTITGHNFWPTPGYTQAYVNGVKAVIQSLDSTQIVCVVPDNATTGRISVQTPVSRSFSSEVLTIYQPGEIWGTIAPPTPYSLLAVCWTGRRFVAVGNLGTILTSEDGLTWTPRASGTINRLNDVIATGSIVVAVGAGGTVVTSADGVDWQLQQSDTSMTISGLAHGSRFLAVGSSGLLLWSDDAVSWNPVRRFTGEWLYGVASTSHGYIAVGHDGTMGMSTTITSWLRLPGITSEHLLAAAEYSGTTIVVGYDGTILTSNSLTSWTERLSGTTAHLGGISVTNDFVVVVGDEGTILTSRYGVSWEVQDSQTGLALYDAAWSGRRLAVVGDSGCIVLSPYIPGLGEAASVDSPTDTAF